MESKLMQGLNVHVKSSSNSPILKRFIHSIFQRKRKCAARKENFEPVHFETPPSRVIWELGPPQHDYPFLLDVADHSLILKEVDALHLSTHLPPRAAGFEWRLSYSTSTHGVSLSTLYRAMGKSQDLPFLILIEDMEGHFFGSYLSCGWRIDERFYGDTTTFVFKGSPDPFEAFKWRSKNFYLMQGKDNFVSVGSGNGKYALWLDSSLDKGRTDECDTFGNPPLSSRKNFQVKLLECWTLEV